MLPRTLIPLSLALVSFTGCAHLNTPASNKDSALGAAYQDLESARKHSLSVPARAAYYLAAADRASARMAGDSATSKEAERIYDRAGGELVTMLRDSDGGRYWGRTMTVEAAGNRYQLNFDPGTAKGMWRPNLFKDFKPASEVKTDHFRQRIVQSGVGATFVGISKSATPSAARANFEPRVGLMMPVTAVVDFKGKQATVGLHDPDVHSKVRVRGREYPMAADLSAAIGFHPLSNELWQGLMGMIKVEKYLDRTGLYMLQPYDPNRIPVIFVHGLMSTPQMWANVIDEMEADPELRGRFQYWVFLYPTGNPVAYSALRCREELARAEAKYPMPQGFVLVGHSMGGLVSRMQTIDTGRTIWDTNLKDKADKAYSRVPEGALLKRALIFRSNPGVKRLVFICVPHRGSEMAMSSIGALGMRLITLPSSLVSNVTQSLGDMANVLGGNKRLPTSINSLSPKNPTLKAMDTLPIRAPYHSIIGDRGRNDTPNSSDGVVPYWSSHLAGAKSELIVPGPHGSYELPQTIAELRRILHLHIGLKDRGPHKGAGFNGANN